MTNDGPNAAPNAMQRGCALLLVWIFVGAGPFVLLLGLISVVRTTVFILTSTATEGEVIALKVVPGKRGSKSYAPIFRFTADDGQIYTVTSKNSTNPPSFAFGERVKVLFEKEHPEGAKIDTFLQLWMFPMVAGIVGGAFSVVTVVVVVKRRKRA
jgi:hypothetical protein